MKKRVTALLNERTGRPVINHFIITEEGKTFFQSYKSIICMIDENGKITLDSVFWNYSATTAKYRSMFLQETTKETEKKIKAGVYKLEKLNQI
jgi:hypothetical protein